MLLGLNLCSLGAAYQRSTTWTRYKPIMQAQMQISTPLNAQISLPGCKTSGFKGMLGSTVDEVHMAAY